MGKLANISGNKAVKAFEKAGWVKRGQVGSHVVLVKQGVSVNLSVPQHKELAPGTLNKLIKYSGMTTEEFLKLI